MILGSVLHVGRGRIVWMCVHAHFYWRLREQYTWELEDKCRICYGTDFSPMPVAFMEASCQGRWWVSPSWFYHHLRDSAHVPTELHSQADAS